MLLGEPGDAQGLGEAGGSGRVELYVTDAALDDEIAHREAGQLALAMRQRDRRRRGKAREIGRLQIPMQGLFEPENPVRLDGAGKFDGVRQVVSRVHVEHQQRLVADRSADRTDPLRFLSQSAHVSKPQPPVGFFRHIFRNGNPTDNAPDQNSLGIPFEDSLLQVL